MTYPLSTALLGMPAVKSCRQFQRSRASTSLFEDNIESLGALAHCRSCAHYPEAPTRGDTNLGPRHHHSGAGLYWYTLQALDERGEVVPEAFSLHELRSDQD